MSIQETLLQALHALYHEPETRAAANEWLEKFQQSVEAWQVADGVLHDPNSNLEVLYFCAQTLRTKVQRDFDDLPSSAAFSLKNSLMVLLKKFSHGPAAVRTQLCLALAALAVQVSAEDWGPAGIVKWLKNELSIEPKITHALLELLTVLPQEAHSYTIAVRPEKRRHFQKELVSSVEDALDLLSCSLSESSTDIREQVLQAFAVWIRLSHGISSTVLATHPLVAAALSGLDCEQTFDAAVDVVAELIRFTVNGATGVLASNMPLVQVLVPRIMALRSRFTTSLKIAQAEKQGINTDDLGEEEEVDVLKGIAYLFAEMSESYAELIANGSSEGMMIVEALAEVASHPEDMIAEVTFNFWHTLSRVLTDIEYYRACGGEAEIESEKERRLNIFRPTYELLVSLVSFRVTYPREFESWRKDELADFKQTRYAVADILMDAALVLGGENTLKLLAQPLFQAAGTFEEGSGDWRSIEARVYCIRAISKAVPLTENIVLPNVMSLIPRLPMHPQVMYTASLTIGAYADWLSAASSAHSLLPSLLEMLIKVLAIPDDPASAAALALKHVCDACRDTLGGSLHALLEVYNQVVMEKSEYPLEEQDELLIIEALSMVANALPDDRMTQALEALCAPLVLPLQHIVSEAQKPGFPQQFAARQYTVPIDRVANIFRYVNKPLPLADLFRRLWPILQPVFALRGDDTRTMERLCRLCKYAVRTCGIALGDVVGVLLNEIAQRFGEHHQSCFLYLASEVIKVFCGEQSCAIYLGNLLVSLFQQTICLLKNIEDFTSRPDVADDCFLLASRCMRYCPQLIVQSPAFSPLFECAIRGVTVQHREACRSILAFLKDVLHMCDSTNGKQFRPVIDSIMLHYGSILTRILIAAILVALPESRIDEVTEVLLLSIQLYGTKVVQWAEETISLLPGSVVTEEERKTFMGAVSSALLGADLPAVSNSFIEMSDVCRRNKKVLEIVMCTLQPHTISMVASG